jgi:signal transduction histidine kinase
MNKLAGQYQHRQLDTCFTYLCNARATALRTGYKKGEAAAYRGLGSYYACRDNSYLSFRFFIDALNLYKEIGDSAGICQTSMHMGVYYQFEGQYKEAANYMKQAMSISPRLKNDTLLSLVLANYYFIYVNSLLYTFKSNREYEVKAHEALMTARHLAEKQGNGHILLYTGMLQAQEMFYRNTEKERGERTLDDLIIKAEKDGYIYHAMYGYALLAAQKGRTGQADSLFCLQQMVRLAMKGGYRELALPVVVKLYTYYDSRHLGEAAAAYGAMMLNIEEKQEESKTQGELDYIDYYMQEKKLRGLRLQHDYQQQILDKKGMESRHRYVVIIFLTAMLLLTILLLVDVNISYRHSRQNTARLGEKNREISEKNALLRTHDDFKNKLISLIAHDFRAPLNHIIDITHLLKDHSLDYEEAAALFRKLENKSEQTLDVFNSILRWIRSQLSGFVYIPVSCTPAVMVRDTLEMLKDSCTEKKLKVAIDIPEQLHLLADTEMLQFVQRNLLHNATKFSPVGGTISITATVANGWATVFFTDEGKGIDAAVLPLLFEFREQHESGKKQGGAGLALIICKDFIDKMGGTIQAINHPEKGSTFSYTLPVPA